MAPAIPRGLTGDEICLESRIVAVADTVETVASHRPYHPARPLETAFHIIDTARGRLFDNDVVEACLAVFADGFSFPARVVP